MHGSVPLNVLGLLLLNIWLYNNPPDDNPRNYGCNGAIENRAR